MEDDEEIPCPNCGSPFPLEFRKRLSAGKKVTCEACGVLIVPKIKTSSGNRDAPIRSYRFGSGQGDESLGRISHQKEPAGALSRPGGVSQPPASSSGSSRGLSDGPSPRPSRESPSSSSSPQDESGYPMPDDAWHSTTGKDSRRHTRGVNTWHHDNFNKWKDRGHVRQKTPRGSRRHQSSRESKQDPQNAPASSGGHQEHGNAPSPSEHVPRLTSLRYRITKYNEISFIATKVLVAIALIGSSFLFIMQEIVFFTNWSAFGEYVSRMVPPIIAAGVLLKLEVSRYHPRIAKGEYRFYGIDIIVGGIVGCIAWGIGVLAIIKGIFVMNWMKKEQLIKKRTKSIRLVEWIHGLDESAGIFVGVITCIAFGTFITNFGNFENNASAAAVLFPAIFGILSYFGDARQVSPMVRDYNFKDLGGKSLVFSIFGLICFGSGTWMVIKSFLIMELEDEQRKVRQQHASHGEQVKGTMGSERQAWEGQENRDEPPTQPAKLAASTGMAPESSGDATLPGFPLPSFRFGAVMPAKKSPGESNKGNDKDSPVKPSKVAGEDAGQPRKPDHAAELPGIGLPQPSLDTFKPGTHQQPAPRPRRSQEREQGRRASHEPGDIPVEASPRDRDSFTPSRVDHPPREWQSSRHASTGQHEQPNLPGKPTDGNGSGAPPPPSNPPSGVSRGPAYLQRQFAVLTPRARRRLRRLKKLDITDEELEMIIEELVFHPEFEQLEIIDEYVRLHGKDELSPKHVRIIKHMNYPDELKEWIFSQVKEMPEEDIDDFLTGLVNSEPPATN
ncbi:hypothetical protein GF325_11095 [Candidatus Bathyarchaeota archaeon]|nr:hypothetical protein [Candidatus Bathyarchaeota archaeon]